MCSLPGAPRSGVGPADFKQVLRLPAPPPKRQKLSGSHLHVQEPAPEPAPFEPPHVDTETEEALEEAVPGAINDTLAALQLLRSRFPSEAGVAPFATKAQLYTLLSDRTAVDRQLEELRRSNAVRLLQLPAGKDEYAILLTEDYCATLRRACAEVQAGSADGGGANTQSAAAAAVAAGAARVFGWMESRVLPACTQVMVTHAELVGLLGGGSGGGSSGGRGGGGGSRPAAAGVAARRDAVQEAHISLLLSHGFLTRHTGGADGYLFSMPAAGPAVRSVAEGRREILSLLQRRRHPELLQSELETRRLQRSVLGVRWHVADMVGAGLLLRLPTTVGPLLRVAPKRG